MIFAWGCGIRFPISYLMAASMLTAAPHLSFDAHGDAAWGRVLGSLGLHLTARASVDDAAVEKAVGHDGAYWMERARRGTLIVTDGASPVAVAAGIVATEATVDVRSLTDPADGQLEIIWQSSERAPVFRMPDAAKVFLRELQSKAPLMAGVRVGAGAVLWTATPLGEEGYERYPTIPQALLELGLDPPLRSKRLWAFFDSSYRTRVDVDYFAERWRKAGIGALHVAAWHYWESDTQRDEFLARLIEACHRQSILVYAWLEFPHVSEAFWDQHPAWREQTAAGQDAHLDWRKLMNLFDPDCEREVWRGTQTLMRRFDWDGANLAELYFESLEGTENLSRFTPMNRVVRERYKKAQGADPMEVLRKGEPMGLKTFLDWRAGLAHELQENWLAKVESLRGERPDLDVVLTHVDDRFDTRMRERIGADAAAALSSLDRHDFTFLVEDPATIWNLGPARYTEIARRYVPITPRARSLAVDINVVERYQDVYPTKRQVGTELSQLVHAAAQAFPRVALYFENSVRAQDYGILPIAAAPGEATASPNGMVVRSEAGTGVHWKGPVLVDGKVWPMTDGTNVWLPAGEHTVQAGTMEPSAHVVDFSGEITHASTEGANVELAYQSQARSYALVDRRPAMIEIDSDRVTAGLTLVGSRWLLRLPRGQHVVSLRFD